MNITIIRHGQTDWNNQNLFQGTTNIPLNSIGIKQAEDLAISLKEEKIDVIFSSPLDRALQTARTINKYHQAPILIDELILERGLGDLEGKCAKDYNLPELWNKILNLSKKSNSVYGIETLEHLLNRAYEFLNKLMLEYGGTNTNVYVVAHGSLNLALLIILGQVNTTKPLQEFKLENCCCYTVNSPTLHGF